MKLNFLNVMNKKSTPDEVAEQIVALEIKRPQYEKIRDEAKKTCKELRGKTMCGEYVDAESIKQADKAYEEAVLDLEIVDDSIKELEKNLHVSLEVNFDEESKKVVIDRKKLSEETEKFRREVYKLKGRLVGLMTGIYHYESEAMVQLGHLSAFSIQGDDRYFAEFTAEKNRALSELKRPTPADLENAVQAKELWLRQFRLDDEYEKILKKYRDQHGVTAPEVEVAGV